MTVVEVTNWAYARIYAPKASSNRAKAHEDYDKFVCWVVEASKGPREAE